MLFNIYIYLCIYIYTSFGVVSNLHPRTLFYLPELLFGFSAFQKWSPSGDGSSGEANDVPYSMAMLGGACRTKKICHSICHIFSMKSAENRIVSPENFPHDITGFYPHQISMVFPWNPHQSLNPNHIHVLNIYIYMYLYIYIYLQTHHITSYIYI